MIFDYSYQKSRKFEHALLVTSDMVMLVAMALLLDQKCGKGTLCDREFVATPLPKYTHTWNALKSNTHHQLTSFTISPESF